MELNRKFSDMYNYVTLVSEVKLQVSFILKTLLNINIYKSIF